MDAEQARQSIEVALAQVAPEADLTGVDAEDDLRQQLDLDSMDFLTLVVRLNELTGVDISEDDYAQLGSLTGAVAFLVRRSAPAASS
jgi:acyl carrier protein